MPDSTGKKVIGFIKINSWMYPLVPEQAPGMKTNFDAYIFPNTDSPTDQSSSASACTFVGITFDKKQAQYEQVALFEDILFNYQSLIYQDKNLHSESVDKKSIIKSDEATVDKESVTYELSNSTMKQSWTAENIAETLITGAEYVSRGVNSTTQYATKYLGLGGEKIKNSLVPNTQAAKVDPTLKTAMQTIRSGTNTTVRVSSYLVDKLTSIASSAAKVVAPHIREGSTHLLTKTGLVSDKSGATSQIDNICKVTGSSIKGFGIIYDSLEQAAKTLGKNFTEQTVTIVDHK